MARLLGFGLLALALVALPACGSKTPSGTRITVKGTLVQNGKPIQPAPKEDDTLYIAFLDPKSNPGENPAYYNIADGTFEIKGPLGAGVVPGEYRVVVTYTRYQGGGGDDVFKEQFSKENSPLKYTVTDDKEQEIVIDVGKRAVTKVK
jgi:hypothetical protein